MTILHRTAKSAEVSDRLKRLAQSIDALALKDEGFVQLSREMAELRRQAAVELHAMCCDFVNSVNRLTAKSELAIDPEAFSERNFKEDAVNLVQIAVRGRILQIAFSSTPELVSTEDFRVPYT